MLVSKKEKKQRAFMYVYKHPYRHSVGGGDGGGDGGAGVGAVADGGVGGAGPLVEVGNTELPRKKRKGQRVIPLRLSAVEPS